MSYKYLEITGFGGPEVFRLVEEETLPEPKKGEVRIKVLAVGAAFTDVMIRQGKYPEIKKKPPFTIGYDMVGRIDKIGDEVEGFIVGQMVADLMVTGACSQYICVQTEQLTVVPEGLDPGEAVSIILSYLTAYQMLNRIAGLQEGQRILVHGAGGAVGTALIQLARLQELEVYGTASSAKHELVAELGAVAIDYRSEDVVKRVYALSKDGVDAVFDPIGGACLKQSFAVLCHGGLLVSYGFYNSVMGKGGNIPLDFLRLKMWDLLPNSRSTAFYSIGAIRKKHPDWYRQDLAVLFDLLARKKIQPVIARRLPITQALEAYELIEKAKVSGKIVLEMT